MYLDRIVQAQKQGQAKGITSICSAHPWVLRAAFQKKAGMLLVESTCNQVNQYGGYTGMTPADFFRHVRGIAGQNNLPFENIILGGDHLGPNPWQDEAAGPALQKSAVMIRDYVRAGFVKIHLDCSMRLGDDPQGALDPGICARRTAQLAKVAESSHVEGCPWPRYVIGTEVPLPGGATGHKDTPGLTKVEDARRTIDLTHEAFVREGLEHAWERVIAVVVQPGVEFGDDFVFDYQPEKTGELSRFIESQPMIYEVHSTDYQTPDALRHLVRGHFAILKVGPGLTYAFRQAVFMLAGMENELFTREARSNFIEVLDQVMLQHPEHWEKHYHGGEAAQAFKRKYSLSDRARYYWPDPRVQSALGRLLIHLNQKPIPFSLLSQFAPLQYKRIRRGELENTPEGILLDAIQAVLSEYQAAQM